MMFRWRYRRSPLPGPDLPERFVVEGHHRFLVVAPHSDDEVLGAGGLLYLAVRTGCPVRVVMLTNGDGYNRAALGSQSRRLRPTPARAIAFAYERQWETRAALQRLGVNESCLTFLGYPDRGLAPMWERHWHANDPYRSRFTGATHSPYFNSRTPAAPFAGISLLADLEGVLQEFRPTHVVVPHALDFHSDHWAGCHFVLHALDQWRAKEGALSSPVVMQYLVHQGAWPRPRGFHPRSLLHPPSTRAGLRFPWLTLTLPKEAVAHKHDALLCYRSQMVFMRSYLLSFVRANELFGIATGATPSLLVHGDVAFDEFETAAATNREGRIRIY